MDYSYLINRALNEIPGLSAFSKAHGDGFSEDSLCLFVGTVLEYLIQEIESGNTDATNAILNYVEEISKLSDEYLEDIIMSCFFEGSSANQRLCNFLEGNLLNSSRALYSKHKKSMLELSNLLHD